MMCGACARDVAVRSEIVTMTWDALHDDMERMCKIIHVCMCQYSGMPVTQMMISGAPERHF